MRSSSSLRSNQQLLDYKPLMSWMDFNKALSLLDSKRKGDAFELLCKYYFILHPKNEHINREKVWLLSEVPVAVKKELGLGEDTGFDLLLQDKTGNYIPVQCKYHSDPKKNLSWDEASTFFGRYYANNTYKEAYICTSAYGVSRHYQDAKTKPVIRVMGTDFQKLDEEFFNQVRAYREGKKASYKPYSPRPHQQKAIKDAKKHFLKENNSKGKLIFPCGSGKSLTGFWLTQELKAKSVVVAVPSLSLVKQTLEVYLREIVANKKRVEWLCICSEGDIGASAEVKFEIAEVGVPCTTDEEAIRSWLERTNDSQRIVFTTYQSGRLIGQISKALGQSFDLGIFDEAHKTVGSTSKLFSYLLFEENINISKRIFMTATERFYQGSKDDIVSMDDIDVYGEIFTHMSFKDAIEQNLLTDYKVITIDVSKAEIASFIRDNKLVELSKEYGKEAEARSLASMLALRKAMKSFGIKNAVSFHSSIRKAQNASKVQDYISKHYDFKPIDSFTVDGKMATGKREVIINEFADSPKALITNARCLTEGVDVPNIDCIVFADPRRSKIDIVQALGRALRKKEGKEWGYVILPVVYDGDTHEIDNDNFKEIIGIIRGLAANDERIIDHFKDKNNLEKSGGGQLTEKQFLFLTETLDESAFKGQLDIKLWEGLSRFNWISYEEAKLLMQPLGLTRVKEFVSQFELGLIPAGIPKAPQSYYYGRGWKSWREFLGGGRIVRKGNYWGFIAAKQFLKNKGITTSKEYTQKIKNDELSRFLPYRPEKYYSKQWQGWGDFLNSTQTRPTEYLSYSEAKHIVRANQVKLSGYYDFYLSQNRNMGLPQNPVTYYKQRGEWVSHKDFFGAGKLYETFLDFEYVRSKALSLGINTRKEYKNWVHSFTSPPKPRVNPQGYSEWVSWDHFFKREYLEFDLAKNFIQKLNLKTVAEFTKAELPPNIPRRPERAYLNAGWKGYADFLGNGKPSKINAQSKLSFLEAKKIAQSLGIATMEEYLNLYRQNALPAGMPARPRYFYKAEFVSVEDFLGANFRSRFTNSNALPFEEARAKVHNLNLSGSNAALVWSTYVAEKGVPEGVPKLPSQFYSANGWVSWRDWLGTKREKIKPTLDDFKTAQKKAQLLGLKTKNVYRNSAKAYNLPTNPNTYFQEFWKGWKDFLGTDKAE